VNENPWIPADSPGDAGESWGTPGDVSAWILQTGFWLDSKFWIDIPAVWHDFPPYLWLPEYPGGAPGTQDPWTPVEAAPAENPWLPIIDSPEDWQDV
jgi:hypothetical protein